MLRAPNARAVSDPKRHPVNLIAIFDDPAADDRLRFEEVKVQARTPFVSFRDADLPYELKPGDEVVIEATGDRYEIKNRVREMVGRTRYDLVKVL